MRSIWAAQVRKLPIEAAAPRHGAFFRGGEMVQRFISWCESLRCGVDLLDAWYPAGYRSAASTIAVK